MIEASQIVEYKKKKFLEKLLFVEIGVMFGILITWASAQADIFRPILAELGIAIAATLIMRMLTVRIKKKEVRHLRLWEKMGRHVNEFPTTMRERAELATFADRELAAIARELARLEEFRARCLFDVDPKDLKIVEFRRAHFAKEFQLRWELFTEAADILFGPDYAAPEIYLAARARQAQ